MPHRLASKVEVEWNQRKDDVGQGKMGSWSWEEEAVRLGDSTEMQSGDGQQGRAGEKTTESGEKLPRKRVSFHQDRLEDPLRE